MSNRHFDSISLGEAVIDFSQCGTGPMGNPAYEMNPGGAPANVVISLAALGGKSAFIGMLGNDLFADHIIKTFKRLNVETCGIRKTDLSSTQMTFVALDEEGDRFFNLVKGAETDHLLKMEDVDFSLIDDTSIVHHPIGMARQQPGHDTMFNVIDYAKRNGKMISYDPNFRPGMFVSRQSACDYFLEGLKDADIVKVSEEEMSIMTGRSEDDFEGGAREIYEMGHPYVFVTMGSKGAYYLCKDGSGFVPSYKVKAVDTTGCGDAFTGTIHYHLMYHPEMPMSEMVRRANAVGALCALKPGAFDAMPTYDDLENFLATQK